MMIPTFTNADKPHLFLKHIELKRVDGSLYRSACPCCDRGRLPVLRDPRTYKILRTDRCTLCAQGVIYTDKEIGGETLTPLPPSFAERRSDPPKPSN